MAAISLMMVSSLASLLAPPRLHAPTLAPLFGAEQFVAIPNFLDTRLVRALAADVHSLRALSTPARASASHGSVEWLVLSPEAPPRHEADDTLGLEGRECLVHLIDELKRHIEREANMTLDAHVELKYAYYPCGGRYQRHIDGMHVDSLAREYSVLLYLNEGWTSSDGGHLRVFDSGGGFRNIAPAAGTLVVFKSDVVPHEVRPTTAKRLAIVGWFHRHVDPPSPQDDAELSPLAVAIRDHYRTQGKTVKMGQPTTNPAAREG